MKYIHILAEIFVYMERQERRIIKMKDYTNKNPTFADTIKIIEKTDPVHADVANEPTKQLLDNDLCLKNAAVGRETEPQTLTAGQTTLVFEVDEIKENDRIEFLASVPYADCDTARVIGNKITLIFIPLEEDIEVKVVVYNELV